VKNIRYWQKRHRAQEDERQTTGKVSDTEKCFVESWLKRQNKITKKNRHQNSVHSTHKFIV